MTNKLIVLLGLALTTLGAMAQKMPVDYDFGETYHDRYRYSNLMAIESDGTGGYLLVRAYYQGMVLRPKGYLIEHYDAGLQLIEEYNYKLRDREFVEGFFRNGQLNLLFLNYNVGKGTYEYWVHTSPIIDFNFNEKLMLSLESEQVADPVGRDFHHRNFGNGFSTVILFNEDKTGFIISTHHKKGKEEKHMIHMFDTALNKKFEYDFSKEIEEKNYAFENLAFSRDLSTAYIVAKAYFKKRRFQVDERRYQYELIKVDASGHATQAFADPGKYPEGLYPLLLGDKLACVGFYADRRDNRYNGIAYFEVDPKSLELRGNRYNAFSEQFMNDKFGREQEQVVKNLVFKGVEVSSQGEIFLNAEEYFVTSGLEVTGTGQRIKIERFHHNDIVSAKLAADGRMEWARNINKTEVTQGDGAYASYSSHFKDGKTYFFICTSAEDPQLLPGERLFFKQGFSRQRNVFLISLDPNGGLDYEKIIDSQEARLPLMVSKPLKNRAQDDMIFYAKRGGKKQLVKVDFH